MNRTRHELDAHFLLQMLINKACLRGEPDNISIEIPWQNLKSYMDSGGVNLRGANLKLTMITEWVEQKDVLQENK